MELAPLMLSEVSGVHLIILHEDDVRLVNCDKLVEQRSCDRQIFGGILTKEYEVKSLKHAEPSGLSWVKGDDPVARRNWLKLTPLPGLLTKCLEWHHVGPAKLGKGFNAGAPLNPLPFTGFSFDASVYETYSAGFCSVEAAGWVGALAPVAPAEAGLLSFVAAKTIW